MKIVFSILCLLAFIPNAKAADSAQQLAKWNELHISMAYSHVINYERQDFPVSMGEVCYASALGNNAITQARILGQDLTPFFQSHIKISQREFEKLMDKYSKLCLDLPNRG